MSLEELENELERIRVVVAKQMQREGAPRRG